MHTEDAPKGLKLETALEREERRIAAVEETGLLDTEPELEFDQIVALAAEICDTPVGMISLIDRHRQWFKSAIGMTLKETPREIAFCDHVIRQEDLLEIQDASQDERFRDNPFVTANPGIRFYAGMPLQGPEGLPLGTICVADTVPRELTPSQRSALRVLAAQVKARMELRQQTRKLEAVLRSKESLLVELAAREQQFRTFMNNGPFMSYMKDEQGRFVFYNHQLARKFNIGIEDWLGKTDFDLFPRDLAKEYRDHDLAVVHGGELMELAEESRDDDGRITNWRSYKFPWRNEEGQVMLGGFSLDVTEEIKRRKELEQANQQLERLATVDTLTGLANRRLLDERVEFEFRFARRRKTPFSVVMLDIDDFKQRNDNYGHAAGDDVLRQLGALILATLRSTDLAGRYGGEEVVILLPGADLDGGILFANRVRETMCSEAWSYRAVTASFGVSAMTEYTTNGEQLIALADDAMYLAKRTGKNRIACDRDVVRSQRAG